MPDSRTHRGPHQQDAELFSHAHLGVLRSAVQDLSWLLERGYSDSASIKIVGDRYQLTSRQRTAVQRSACADSACERRQARLKAANTLHGATLWIDGFNLLTTIEAALGGCALLKCRDGTYRDMASMCGTYRKVVQTSDALSIIGEQLSGLGVVHTEWLLDSPVSNSARLAESIRECGERCRWSWAAVLEKDPDQVLSTVDGTIVSADSQILDRCSGWVNLARIIVETRIQSAWVLDLEV